MHTELTSIGLLMCLLHVSHVSVEYRRRQSTILEISKRINPKFICLGMCIWANFKERVNICYSRYLRGTKIQSLLALGNQQASRRMPHECKFKTVS